MGGREYGEVASSLCISTMNRILKEHFPETLRGRRLADQPRLAMVLRHLVDRWVRDMNVAVRNLGSKDKQYREMGTTVAMIFHQEDYVVVAHVGDSRVYRVRQRKMEPVTNDHSLVNEQLKHKLITPEEAAKSRLRNILIRAVGPSPTVQPDVTVHDAVVDDLYLLCSDGLSDLVTDAEIEQVVNDTAGDLSETIDVLIALANARGGKDNITVVLARVDEPREDIETQPLEHESCELADDSVEAEEISLILPACDLIPEHLLQAAEAAARHTDAANAAPTGSEPGPAAAG